MTTIERHEPAAALPDASAALFRLAGAATLLSGVVSIAMVALLLAMYAAFAVGASAAAMAFGWVNDVLAIVVYGLALPAVVALHQVVRGTGEVRSLALAVIGAGGIAGTIWLQWLLASGALTFQQQIGSVSVALLGVAVWMIGTGYLARKVGFLPHGLRNGILGGFYLGYPVWGIALGRRLLGR
jgi:hypothetical protein